MGTTRSPEKSRTLGFFVSRQVPQTFRLVDGLHWWFGFGFEPLVLVEGKWETTPLPPNHQSKPEAVTYLFFLQYFAFFGRSSHSLISPFSLIDRRGIDS